MEISDERLWTLLRPPQGPVAPYVDALARELSALGFNRRSICVQVRSVAYFSSWLKANHVALEGVTDEHIHRFLHRLKLQRVSWRGVCATLRRLLGLLRQLGVVPEERLLAEATPIQNVVAAFGRYLRDDKGLSHATGVQYLSFAEQFLAERFGSGAVELRELCAADVVGFIRRQAARLSRARAKSATIALRSFLRYLRYRGEFTMDLAAAVPTVPNWSMTGIPRAISAAHLHAVLASCRRDTAVGCRDYAILILLARLGLRSGEVVALNLDSIDWEIGSVMVVGSKGGPRSQLPLPADVGQAIADYLQRGRPPSSCRTLFLRANAPIRGLGSPTSIGTIVRAAIGRAGVQTRYWGAHQFRHALACEMLRQGANLIEIGSLLRHRHPKTTGIYAKVDFAALRPLGLAWPRVAR